MMIMVQSVFRVVCVFTLAFVGLIGDVSAAVIGYQDAVLADSPVAFWRLGESSGTVMTDISGNGLNGTYNNNVSLGQTGVGTVSDMAAGFGLNAVASVPSNAAYDFVDYTLEAWVKLTGTIVPDMRIVSRQGSKHWLLHTKETSPGVVQLSAYSSLDGVSNFTAGPNLNDGEFHHVAITRDTTADLISLYVDGLLAGSMATTNNAAFTDSANVYVGSYNGSGQFFRGIIDEVALYGTALSAAQIEAHFLAGTYIEPIPEPSSLALVGWAALAVSMRRRKNPASRNLRAARG